MILLSQSLTHNYKLKTKWHAQETTSVAKSASVFRHGTEKVNMEVALRSDRWSASVRHPLVKESWGRVDADLKYVQKPAKDFWRIQGNLDVQSNSKVSVFARVRKRNYENSLFRNPLSIPTPMNGRLQRT